MMKDSVFFGDTSMLLRPDDMYNHFDAFEFVKKELIEKF